MHISVITLFPEMFHGILSTSILKRAQEKQKFLVSLINLRDFGIGKHKTVDDAPYGGGAGMVLRVDVLKSALNEARKQNKNTKFVLLDPRGTPFTQSVAEELSKEESITLICGHYEGYDERIREYVDREISLGDFVLTGGEIPAMAIIDSVVRLLPGVLGKDESAQHESFSEYEGKRILEHPHYTRPPVFEGGNVPLELLSGNHKKIDEIRRLRAVELTQRKRPDLLKTK